MAKLKVYTSMDEYNKIHHYRQFAIEECAYELGDTYNGETVMEVEEVIPDVENNTEVFDYKHYHLLTTMNGSFNIDEDEYCEYYISVKREEV